MRGRFLSLCAFLIGCQGPDLGPVREDIARNAAVVCAPSTGRTPPFAKTRDVSTQDIESAIVSICQLSTDAALDTLHEGLAQDEPVVALAHKNRMLLDAPRLDFSAPRAMDTVDKAAGACKKTWPGLGRAMITSAEGLAKEKPASALGRCLDVVAMARDADLVGDALDSLLANSDIQIAVVHCSPIAEQAPKAIADAFARELLKLKQTFPANLNEVFKRDRAETAVFNFGQLRDPSATLPCPLATDLSKGMGDLPTAKSDQRKLVDAWTRSQAQEQADTSKYTEAYMLSLQTLDKLIDRAMRPR